MLLPTIVLVLAVYIPSSGGQNAVIDVDICKELQSTVTRFVHLMSPGFPAISTNSRNNCACSFSANSLAVSSKLVYLIGYNEHTAPLKVSYSNDGNGSDTWPGPMAPWSLADNYVINVAENVSHVNVTLNTSLYPVSQLLFIIDVRVKDPNDELVVSCRAGQSESTQDDGGNGDQTLPSFIDKLCSPQFLVVLGSCCLGVCLVILMMSVCVCCLMSRKRRRRGSASVTSRSKPAPSAIYDDATVKLRRSGSDVPGNGLLRPGDLGPDNKAVYRRSNSMPMKYNRHVPSAQYANTTEMAAAYGNTFHPN